MKFMYLHSKSKAAIYLVLAEFKTFLLELYEYI